MPLCSLQVSESRVAAWHEISRRRRAVFPDDEQVSDVGKALKFLPTGRASEENVCTSGRALYDTGTHKSLTGETGLLSFITATERMRPGGRGGVGGGSVGPAGGSGFHPHAPSKTWGLHPGLPRRHLPGQTDSGLIPSLYSGAPGSNSVYCHKHHPITSSFSRASSSSQQRGPVILILPP